MLQEEPATAIPPLSVKASQQAFRPSRALYPLLIPKFVFLTSRRVFLHRDRLPFAPPFTGGNVTLSQCWDLARRSVRASLPLFPGGGAGIVTLFGCGSGLSFVEGLVISSIFCTTAMAPSVSKVSIRIFNSVLSPHRHMAFAQAYLPAPITFSLQAWFQASA